MDNVGVRLLVAAAERPIAAALHRSHLRAPPVLFLQRRRPPFEELASESVTLVTQLRPPARL